MSKESIFVIEDEFTKKIDLRQQLEDEGFNATPVSTDDALAKAKSEKPSVIITDIHGNNKDDETEFLRSMIEAEELANSCIFILTESLEISTEIELRKLKLSHYFLQGEESGSVIIAEIKKLFEKEDDTATEIMARLNENKMYEDTASLPVASHALDILDDDDDDDDDALSDIIDEIEVRDGQIVEPADGHSSFKEGKKLFAAGKFQEAIEKFKAAEKDSSMEVKSALLKGICYRNIKDYKNAVITLQDGKNKTKNKSEKLEFYYQLGVSLQEIGKHKAALEFFGRIFKIDKSLHDTTKRIKQIMAIMKSKD